MVGVSRELATRGVMWQQCEFAGCRNRPMVERVPVPIVGQRVLYRRDHWAEELWEATVVWVQDLNDRSDPNLWHPVKNTDGVHLHDRGIPRYVRVADPWPLVGLRGEWPAYPGAQPETRESQTRESRLRGSAGWLPLDHALRPERWRLPAEAVLVERPPLPPVNVPSDVVVVG